MIEKNIKIWVVTNNVQNVNSTTKPVSYEQAAVWGFSKTARLEYPQLWGGIIDVGSLTDAEIAKSVLQEILVDEESEVCVTENLNRYVERLTLFETKSGAGKKLSVRDNATYVIAGGTGALGVTVCDYLISHGSRHIALLSRSRPADEMLDKLQLWKEKGILVNTYQCDVTDKDSVEEAFAKIRSEMPIIKGMVAAMGTLDDKAISNMTWQQFLKVFCVKAYGSVNLHNAIRNSLDFYVMFSSVASTFGNIGQSNYAAANYFLNIYSRYLRTLGVPAYSICWGPWGEKGMAARNTDNFKLMKSQGLSGLSHHDGAEIFGKIVAEEIPFIVAADIDFLKYKDAAGSKDIANFLSDITGSADESKSEQKTRDHSDILETLGKATPENRQSILSAYLQNIVAKVMEFPAGRLPLTDKSLMEQGADSLMMFSIRNEISKITGKEMNVSIMFNYPTICELSGYLISSQLSFSENCKPKAVSQKAEDILSQIDSLLKE